MADKKQQMVSMKLPSDEAKRLKEVAEKRGVTLTDFCRTWSIFGANLDEGFLKFVEDAAENLQVPFHIFIQNMLISKLAEDDARDDVFGYENPMMFEFQFDRKTGVRTGKDLYDALYEMHKGLFEAQKKDQQ